MNDIMVGKKNPLNNGRVTEQDMLNELHLDSLDLTPQGMAKGALQGAGVDVDGMLKEITANIGSITKSLAVREGAFLAAQHIFTPLSDKIIDLSFNALGNVPQFQEMGLSVDHAKELAKKGVTGLAIGTESLLLLKKALDNDGKLRLGTNAALLELNQAGEKGLNPHAISGNHPNKVLEAEQHRIQAQTHEHMIGALVALIGSGAQWYAKQVDAPAWKDGLLVEQSSLSDQLTSATKAQKPAIESKLKSIEKSLKQDTRNIAEILATKKGDSPIGHVNQATVAAIGGGYLANKLMGDRTEKAEKIANHVIALDSILFLDNFLKKEKLNKNGEINISAFKVAHPHHKFHFIDNKDSSIPLEDFITEIFRQHLHDNGSAGVGSLHEDKLVEASKQLADAITGKDLSISTLRPISLVKIIGEGNIVDHNGESVGDTDAIRDIIEVTRKQFSNDPAINSAEFIAKMSRTPNELGETFNTLRDKNPKMADFMAFLLPTPVIKEQLNGFETSDIVLRAHKLRGQEHALGTLKETVSDLASLSDAQLSEHQMLGKKQIALIRDAEKYIKAGDDEKLLLAAREGGVDGLRFAVINAGEYWQDIAKGQEVGELSHPKEKTCEMKSDSKEETREDTKSSESDIFGAVGKNVTNAAKGFKDTLTHAANNILPFGDKAANDDHPKAHVTDSTKHGKVTEVELSAAR